MINVSDYIKKLLYEQDCVVVPELGGFLSHFNHAFYSGINGYYHSPAKRVAFNEALKLDDGLLIHYISVNEQISREDAQVRVREFVNEIKSEINKWGSYKLPDVGILMSNQENKLLFEPYADKNYYQEGYGLKSIAVNTVNTHIPAEDIQLELDLSYRTTIEKPTKSIRWRSKVAMYSSSILLFGGLFYASSDTPLSSSSRSSLNPLDLFVKNSTANLYSKNVNIDTKTHDFKVDKVENVKSVPVKNEKIILPVKITPIVTPNIKVPEKIKPELVVDTVSKPIIQVNFDTNKERNEITSDENARFFVIAGAFSKEENAQKLVEKLKASGYSDASMMMIDDRSLFKVSAVGLSSQVRASSQMSRINKLSKAQSWIFVVD